MIGFSKWLLRCAAVLVAVATLPSGLRVVIGGLRESEIAEAVVLFFALRLSLLRPRDGSNLLESLREDLTDACLGAALVLTLTLALASATGVSMPTLVQLMRHCIPAAVEEIIFRKRLPNLVHRDLALIVPSGYRVVFVVFATQLTFSLSHSAAMHRLLPVGMLFNLFAAGVALFVVYRAFGLWLSVTFHAAMNLQAAMPSLERGILNWELTSNALFLASGMSVLVLYRRHRRNQT